ncbi:MAG TPA: lipase maturation factor family protein, partial [Microbacterium sp.]|uniref:lipase maturation factor family protein n=1 Tax=Microbacterium sp. TaxID=51671 RepID=UPI002C269156
GAAAAAIVLATQLWLVITGNFAWLNWATIVLACSAIGLQGSLLGDTGERADAGAPGIPLYWVIVTGTVGLVYVVLSWWPLRNLVAHRQLMNASFNRWQLANAYGAFGTVTKQRIEVVVEGTTDRDPRTATWREYHFKGKPGDLQRIPRQYAPYHLRLDWLMWFLPLGRMYEPWFEVLLLRLLEADAPTLRLLDGDPFEGRPPTWVRARTYLYRFATRAEHRESGDHWVREPRAVVLGPVRRPHT